MNKITQVMKHEFLKMVKSKGFIIITLLFPLAAFLALGAYQLTQRVGTDDTTAEVVTIGYVDQTGGFAGTGENEEITFVEYQTAEGAMGSLLAGDINEYFVISPDYVSSGRIDRFTLEREVEIPGSTARAVRNFLLDNLLQGTTSDDVLERAKMPAWFVSTRLDDTGQISTEQGGVLAMAMIPYVFSFLFWLAILMGSFTLLEGLGEEKESRVMEILLSSVSAKQLLLGKVIGLGVAVLIQIIFWFFSARYIVGLASETIGGMFSGLQIPVSLIVLGITYFILGYVLFAILYAIIGAIVPTYREGQQLSFFIIMPGVMPLMLIYLFIENPGHLLVTILTFIPISTPVASMIRLGIGGISSGEIIIGIVLLVISIVGLFLFGTKVFRTFLLMYGKSPSPREILKALRQA
jgi:ABC-2 type transport system permease protein